MKELFPYINKNRVLALGGVLGVFALTGCGEEPNYAGKGNEFEIIATVEHTGKRSITTLDESVKVIAVRGLATGWFDKGEHQIHDNYKSKEGSFNCEEIISVGETIDATGNPVELENILPGTRVEIEGAIRDSSENQGKGGCPLHQRPVYDTVTILEE